MPELEEIMKTALAVMDEHTALVITLTTYLDRSLERIFEENFVEGADSRTILLNDGPLATLSAKIKLGFALGFFNEAISARLDTLRELRNCFAHSSTRLHFSLPEVQAVCERLKYDKLFDDSTAYPQGHARWKQLQYQFVMTTLMLSGTIVRAAAEFRTRDPAVSPNVYRLLRGGLDYRIPMQESSPQKSA